MKENKEKAKAAKKRVKNGIKKNALPRTNRREEEGGFSSYLDKSRLISLSLFLFFAVSIGFLCSTRQAPVAFQITEGKIPRKGITAKFDFNYISEIETTELLEETRRRVHPIYKLTNEPFDNFVKFVDTFFLAQKEVNETKGKLLPEEHEELISNKIQEIEKEHGISLNQSVFKNFLAFEDRERLRKAFNEGIVILKEIYNQGVVDESLSGESGLMMFKLSAASGDTYVKEVMSLVDALRRLRLNTRVIQIEEKLPDGLYHIFRKGLTTNLVYDEVATKQKIDEKLDSVDPVIIKVDEGVNVIDEGRAVTQKDFERYSNYYDQLLARSDLDSKFLFLFLERLLIVVAIIIAILVYFRVVLPDVISNNRLLSICGMSILLTLVLIRLLLEFGGTGIFKENPEFISVLPYLSPVMLPGMIVMMMIGDRAAMITAVAMSCFYAIIQNGSVESLILAMVASFVSIFFCRDIRFRSSIVRASSLGGVAMGVLALVIGLLSHFDFLIIGWHMIASITVGVITGVVAVGVIPVFESAFNRTTEISLLELTDFNHPLLRRLQNEAPGTYQHSMMVANLSENAALAIGCSPLVCRVSSLFHDIGKLVKPEYFTENQRDGWNPHMERNPSMSALVIKSHVKEGIDLARRYSLPKVIKEVIRQHHGTSLIQYFYYEALKKSTSDNLVLPDSPDLNLDKVDESTYRYDGPKPQFKESAIIFFADSIEAASRSLKKVNNRTIEELLDHIVKERIEDDQLDECPLTLQEIAKIKESFTYTLLNVYHSRVEYPKMKKEERHPVADKVLEEKVSDENAQSKLEIVKNESEISPKEKESSKI